MDSFEYVALGFSNVLLISFCKVTIAMSENVNGISIMKMIVDFNAFLQYQ